MPEEMQPVENAPEQAPTGQEPGSEPTNPDNSNQFQMPDKFAGKSAEDIAKSYLELEKRYGNYGELQQKAELYEQLTPILEKFSQPDPEPQAETPQFETAEDLINYVDKNIFEKKWADRERAIEEKFNARLEAQTKLNELREAYPEDMKDHNFRSFVIHQMNQNPNLDPLDIAKGVKGYLDTVKQKGAESAKQELIQKGTYQGKAEGNQPYESDEDKAIKDRIINAGGDNKGSIF